MAVALPTTIYAAILAFLVFGPIAQKLIHPPNVRGSSDQEVGNRRVEFMYKRDPIADRATRAQRQARTKIR